MNCIESESEVVIEIPEFNEELFLKCICNYPAIYNPSSKAYSNRMLKETAYENIARTMLTTVDICKRKWKSLKEKYNREKHKLEMMSRSGAPAFQTNKWQFMSFFEYMYDDVTPRSTQSSSLSDTGRSIELEEAADVTLVPSNEMSSSVLPSTSACSTPPRRTQKRKITQDNGKDPVIEILSKVSNSIEKVSNSAVANDKFTDFARYLCAELREWPYDKANEFMDETLIRLLQTKRKIV
ncbi:uncharacterized protein LOC116181335 isoform X2 [Photinus pyralis]|uniref:uncharacterized protein LOC116159189 isoform X2 n=1 Tax=Photinus pyralis TaxID=7054 RepID=UPI001266E684|nr:uncharacterized protein LOC116159189 isoform X2 [Photinus pyralis]XP_031332466.1 uncharacterized protein LOC116162863 isoform X2 [Photinus pyralis]XP_031332470.1 uncharacterized protein LOC116162864 isoform X2 [Photinus pyralis]XP_031357522.1 uncharacterized protein LOC116181335 isoform X2 [Photinus pyralis]